MTDELAARRANRDDDHNDPELAALAALRGEPLRLAVAEHLENQQATLDRVAGELDRLGKGCVKLRDDWAGATHIKALVEAAARLDELLCGRGEFYVNRTKTGDQR